MTRVKIISALCEGNSIRSITRMYSVGKNTIAKLLIQAGAACAVYQDEKLRNLQCKRIQCDEIWSYIGAKDKNVPMERRGEFGVGSVWTWTALDADSKLICSWMIGDRSAASAYDFISDLAGRLANRVQLTTDGHAVYVNAVEAAFGADIDYAQLVKIYGETAESEKRYSPAECIGCKRQPVIGDPDAEHISTSYVERQNLTMRMHMRRFARLTNGFSKKLENHIAAVALHFFYYNFIKTHGTVRMTPAMAAGVVSSPMEVSDIVKMVEAAEAERAEAERQKKAEMRDRSYNPFGDALGGKGLK